MPSIIITPELLVAMSGLFTAIFVGVGQYKVNQSTAKKNEVDLLREEVVRLQARVETLESKNVRLQSDNDSLRIENALLREEITLLRALLRSNNIPIPPSKIFPVGGLASA